MARDIRAGRAFVEIFLRDKLKSGLRGAANKIRGFSRSIGRLGGILTATGGAMAAPFIATIGPASDMQETMSKFETVFGEQTEAVKQWGDEFAAQVGRSKKQVAGFLAESQDLFVPLGFDDKSAEDMSKQLTELSVDLASFNNKQDADVLRDLQSALTGSAQVMKKYGVVINQAALNQELLNMGMDPKTADEQAKVQARLNLIMRGTTAAQGDATRTAGSWANQMKRAKAILDDTAVAIGSALLPVITPLLTHVNTVATMVGEWIQENQQLIATIAKVVAAVVAGGAALMAIAGAGIALSAVLTGLGTIAGVAAGAVGLIGTVIGAILSPIGLAVAAVTAAGGALLHFSGTGSRVASFLGDTFGQLFGFMKETFGAMGDALAAGDLAAAGKILWLTLQIAFQKGKGAVMAVWSDFTTTLMVGFDAMATALRKVWNNVTTLIAQGIVQVIGLVQRVLDQIAKIDPTGLAAKLRKTVDIDVAATIDALSADRDKFNQQLEQAKKTRNDERAAALSKQLAETESALADLREARAEAISGAADKRKEAELDAALAKAKTPEQEAPDTSGLAQAADKFKGGSSASTFSGAAAALLQFGNKKAEERTADAAEKTADNTEEMKETVAQLTPKFS